MEDNVVIDAINTFYEYTYTLEDSIQSVVEFFRMQRENEGLNLLMKIIEGLDWCVQVITRTKSLFESYEMKIYDESINNKLIDLENAVGNRDFVFAADLLEYELVDIIKYWRECILQLRQTDYEHTIWKDD